METYENAFSLPPPLIKIEDWFLMCQFLSYKSIYSINVLYVGQASKGKNVKIWKCVFLPFNEGRGLIFSVHIPLIFSRSPFQFSAVLHISYNFKQLRYLWMLSSLLKNILVWISRYIGYTQQICSQHSDVFKLDCRAASLYKSKLIIFGITIIVKYIDFYIYSFMIFCLKYLSSSYFAF